MRNPKLIKILAILILGFLLASGCINYNVSPPQKEIVYVTVYATPAPASTQSSNDPIVGTWRYYNTETGFDDRYLFRADGTFQEAFRTQPASLLVFEGTWQLQGTNTYLLIDRETGIRDTFIYDPAQHNIYDVRYAPIKLIPYPGDLLRN